ncbi:hypothetical protein LH51_14640 [Nitrincola sp. A-D6]|uniref:hypothetical protein n=1 Tax=Nitrincola sp. A-D6 TaxID=1545442 RepID=UPI00051FEBFC|nr:hypothetical protein [Nitrincola sp. A-D6]KGK41475.1 hypothetical protein LH51_14640 [Nitrincola sp. A-D6]
MTTSLCPEELRSSATSLFPTVDVCQTLKAEYGISIIAAAEKKYLVTRTAVSGKTPFRYLVGREVGHLIGPMVGLLEPSGTRGVMLMHIRNEVDNCYHNHGDILWKSETLRFLSQDPLQAVLRVAEHDSCKFENLWNKIKSL